MAIMESEAKSVLADLLNNQLKPLVRKIDTKAYYPREFFENIGKYGFLLSAGLSKKEVLAREIQLVEKTAKICMTTAFTLWCHLAALTYLRTCENSYLKQEVLPLLESGKTLGGTGLSNPMKYYDGLESLHLQAERTQEGYIINGHLPSVSNLGPNHWFGIIASVNEKQRIMAFVPCHAQGLALKEKLDYLGLNGSATYACTFNDVFIPDQWIISEHADDFVQKIRPVFLIYQIPLGLGVTAASIQSMKKIQNKQNGCNRYLSIQPEELENELTSIREEIYRLVQSPDLTQHCEDLLRIRLNITYLTLKAVHGSMLHHGGAGYLQQSDPSRRLREAYFFANLTPTVKHLEKLLNK